MHQKAVAGDKKAVNKAYELLEKVRQAAPQNNLVEAYYGSVLSLQGRDAIDPNDRFQKAVKGLKVLDGAVSKEPDNVEIRILRSLVCNRLPEMYFHRTASAVEDFQYLLSRYEKDHHLFTQEFYWKVLYELGVAYKKLGRHQEAQSVWRKLQSQTDKYNEFIKGG